AISRRAVWRRSCADGDGLSRRYGRDRSDRLCRKLRGIGRRGAPRDPRPQRRPIAEYRNPAGQPMKLRSRRGHKGYVKDAKATRPHRDHRVSFAAFAFTTLVSAITAAPVHAESVLKFVPHADLTIIDPHWTGAYITRNYGYMVYDTLFALD